MPLYRMRDLKRLHKERHINYLHVFLPAEVREGQDCYAILNSESFVFACPGLSPYKFLFQNIYCLVQKATKDQRIKIWRIEMKRLILSSFILIGLLLSGCGNSQKDLESVEATSRAETLSVIPIDTLVPIDTPIPEGLVEIPDVIGMKRDEAYELLEDLGLVPLTYWVVNDEIEYGIVTDIEPLIGEFVQEESEVVLNVVGEVLGDPGGGEGTGGTGSSCGPQPSSAYCNVLHDFKNWCACMGGTYWCEDITYKGHCLY